MTLEERTARKEQRQADKKAAKKAAAIQAERDQKPVKSIAISIEWRKSRTWGSNPFLDAQVSFQDGSYESVDGITCSGCGYDKESTVIAQVFNMFMKYSLWEIHDLIVAGEDVGEMPYGIYIRQQTDKQEAWMNFNGGVGTSCYYRIAEFIGGKFERVASGKTYDAYKFTMHV